MARKGRSFGLVLLGLVLLAVSAAWFLTPLSTMVMDQLAGNPSKVGGAGPASFRTRGAPTTASNWELFNTALNAINALFGGIGIYLAARGMTRGPRRD
ncbi:MAG: hypothetical protein AB7E80_17420 [Hyphomicrobiaceae bacterium]